MKRINLHERVLLYHILLEEDGILNGAGHEKWNKSDIKQILTNEKYIGDALLQKTYMVDILE